MTKIGFIGTGVMGSSIVNHLLAAGHELHLYTRTPSKAAGLLDKGAKWQASPKALAEECSLIFSMVGYPADVEEIYFGPQGVFQGLQAGSLLVDLTTSTPSLAKKIAAEAQALGSDSLDAPVSGGDLGAQKGTLAIMVGGREVSFDKALPYLETFGANIQYMGPAGSGQHTKMTNQIMVAGTLCGMGETLAYAQKAGLDLDKVISLVGSGAAGNWSLVNYGPRILKDDYSPGFFIKHFVKDLGIALAEAEALALDLPMTALAYQLYQQLEAEDYADLGVQAIMKLWW